MATSTRRPSRGNDQQYAHGEEIPEGSKDELSESSRDYLRQIGDVLNNEFSDNDDKELFIGNVFHSLAGEEIIVATNYQASFLIEKILRVSNLDQASHYAEQISKNITDLCINRHGSHVLQTLLEVFQGFCFDKDSDMEKEEKKATTIRFIDNFVILACKKMDEWIADNYACHVICSLIDLLCNTKVSQIVHQNMNSSWRSFKKENESKDHDLIRTTSVQNPTKKRFTPFIKRIIKAVKELNNLPELIMNTHSSLTLQAIMLALSAFNADYCEQFVNIILGSLSGLKDGLLEICSNSSNAFLLEKIIEVLKPTLFEEVIWQHFKGKLNKLATNSNGNFVVQRLIKHCPNKGLFEKIYAELENSWPEISNEGHLGVLTSLCESCVRLKACQLQYHYNLFNLLKWNQAGNGDNQFALLCAYFTPLNEWRESSPKERSELSVNYHGSCLLQNLLRFNNANLVIKSLRLIPIEELEKLFCSSYGSYIFDAFVSSYTVPDQKKSSLANRLKECVVNLACNKHGSRCFDTLWTMTNMAQKTKIIKEMCANLERLEASPSGRFISRKCAVSLYKKRPDDWLNWLSKEEKNKRKLKDIFEDTYENEQSKRKK